MDESLFLRVCYVARRGVVCKDRSLVSLAEHLVTQGLLMLDDRGRYKPTKLAAAQISREDAGKPGIFGLPKNLRAVEAFKAANQLKREGKIDTPFF